MNARSIHELRRASIKAWWSRRQRDPNSRCDNDKNDKLGPDHQTFCDIVWLLFSSDAPGLRLMETSLLWLSSDQRFRDDDCGWGGVDDDVVINWSKNKCVEILINVWWVTIRFNKYFLSNVFYFTQSFATECGAVWFKEHYMGQQQRRDHLNDLFTEILCFTETFSSLDIFFFVFV